ncbi:MAG: TM0106 family RecB-like putative nuclease [Actinomycetes bacterium]
MTERFITPSKITAWLDCAHFLTLKHEVEDGLRKPRTGGLSSFAQLLADKGVEHEAACLDEYERQGKSILRVPTRTRGEPFESWVARVGNPFDQGRDVIYQMPLAHEGIRGIADFLVRVEDNEGGTTYEPVDAKLARKDAKPGHVLQLCFYSDAIEAITGRRPARMHLWLGSGKQETLAVDDFGAYWRRLRAQLSAVVDAPAGTADTKPEPCNHCAFCEFADVCDAQWRDEDSLIYVAGIRSTDRTNLEEGGVPTLKALSARTHPVEGLPPERQARLVVQAQLQVQARNNAAQPPFVLIDAAEDATWGHGFEQLPAPDTGDVFLDFEGHPFWRADTGLFFLFGLIEQDPAGTWQYRTWWAHTVEEEGAAAHALIEWMAARRAEYPGMHIYHYNHTERSSLERLAADYGRGEVTLATLVDTGAFVDLLVVARNAIQVGTESYGLKALERLTSYERGHEIDQGAGAVLEYERYMSDGAMDALARIAAYNEDDVRATRALRDWLIDHRPADMPWRAAELEPEEQLPELDEQVARLHAFGPDTLEHLLGDVLGYWRREWSAHLAPLRARCDADKEELLEDPEALAGLALVGPIERVGKNGKLLPVPGMRFILDEQDCSGLTAGDSVIFTTPDGRVGYSTIDRVDLDVHEVDLVWSEKSVELDHIPSVVVRNGWVSPNPKPAVLSELAARVLDPTGVAPNPLAMALLRRDLPSVLPSATLAPDALFDDVDLMPTIVAQLNGSYIAVQGPPGTGKTYQGARLVRALVKAGKRVGITAMSHHAIDNLLEAVIEMFEEEGDLHSLRAVRRGSAPSRGGLNGVTYAPNNKGASDASFNLVAGTTWLFASKDLLPAPVDVLLIDEAGQLALVDALAAIRSAHNLVLLGDPLQLPQVSQASHPGGGGRSVLEHVLGEDATMPPERGFFLSETRRMHPDICTFISDVIYEGRLSSHPSCASWHEEFRRCGGFKTIEHNRRVRIPPNPNNLCLNLLDSPQGDRGNDGRHYQCDAQRR